MEKRKHAPKKPRARFIRAVREAATHRSRTLKQQETAHAEGCMRRPVTPAEFNVWLNEQDWGST